MEDKDKETLRGEKGRRGGSQCDACLGVFNALSLLQTNTHTQTRTHTHTQTRTCTRTRTHTHTHTHTHKHKRTHVRTHTHIHLQAVENDEYNLKDESGRVGTDGKQTDDPSEAHQRKKDHESFHQLAAGFNCQGNR